MRKILFSIKQVLKMVLQNFVLPVVYRFWRLVYFKKKMDLIIFADAHHDAIPFSMERMHDALQQKGYQLTDVICDYGKMSQLQSALHAVRFMRLYARARYVFICDNFLPVSSCRKSKRTTVVQLLHASGTFKKFGYDATDDIPAGYIGNVYRNYDLVTVSSTYCEKTIRKSMKQPKGVVKALGSSRSDCYFDKAWLERCKTEFYARYPEAEGKKIILWAPTFRGNAADPKQVGMEAIQQLEKTLGEEYFVIYKVHPHTDARYHLSNCNISTERLYAVVDLLISDYSSVVFDFLLFKKPYVLFAPDLYDYQKKRGFYIKYNTLTPYIVTKEKNLKKVVIDAMGNTNGEWIERNKEYHLNCCDGCATERIMKYIGL